MSKFKDQTGNTLQSSSGASTEVLERPSLQLASSDNTPTSTQSTNPSSTLTTQADNTVTTPLTTEKARQQSMILRAVLSYFLKHGLVRRYRVLSEDRATVLKIRYEFDMTQWTEDLEPK
jgi:D-arabinose 5-phosphate isomerase GutQ